MVWPSPGSVRASQAVEGVRAIVRELFMPLMLETTVFGGLSDIYV